MEQHGLFDTLDHQQRQLREAQQQVWAWRAHQGPRPSQKVRILADLADSGDMVCGAKWLDARMPRYAAVIHDLRSQGWDIGSGPCVHGQGVFDYGLASLR